MQSEDFNLYHGFSHNNLEGCFTRFINHEINLHIDDNINSRINRNNIEFFVDIYYIENNILLENQLKIYFIVEILYDEKNFLLANGVYNILSSLIYVNNINDINCIRHGAVSILQGNLKHMTRFEQTRSRSATSTESSTKDGIEGTTYRSNNINNDIQIVGSIDNNNTITSVNGNNNVEIEIKLSPNGKEKFLKMIAKILQIKSIKFISVANGKELLQKKIDNTNKSNSNMVAMKTIRLKENLEEGMVVHSGNDNNLKTDVEQGIP